MDVPPHFLRRPLSRCPGCATCRSPDLVLCRYRKWCHARTNRYPRPSSLPHTRQQGHSPFHYSTCRWGDWILPSMCIHLVWFSELLFQWCFGLAVMWDLGRQTELTLPLRRHEDKPLMFHSMKSIYYWANRSIRLLLERQYPILLRVSKMRLEFHFDPKHQLPKCCHYNKQDMWYLSMDRHIWCFQRQIQPHFLILHVHWQ